MPPSRFRQRANRSGTRPPEIMVAFAAGAGANTNITVTGIRPSDQLIAVLEVQPPTAASGNLFTNNRTAATTITADNTIRVSSATTGNQLLVMWYSF